MLPCTNATSIRLYVLHSPAALSHGLSDFSTIMLQQLTMQSIGRCPRAGRAALSLVWSQTTPTSSAEVFALPWRNPAHVITTTALQTAMCHVQSQGHGFSNPQISPSEAKHHFWAVIQMENKAECVQKTGQGVVWAAHCYHKSWVTPPGVGIWGRRGQRGAVVLLETEWREEEWPLHNYLNADIWP